MRLKEAILTSLQLSPFCDLYARPGISGLLQEDSEAFFEQAEGAIFFANAGYIQEHFEIAPPGVLHDESAQQLIDEINEVEFGKSKS